MNGEAPPAPLLPPNNSVVSGTSSWLYNLEQVNNSPSRRTGMNEDSEGKERRKTIKMIKDIASDMRWVTSTATACVFFHRFYMIHSMNEFPPRIAALGCLFLAGKVEETPKKCRDILALAKDRYPSLYQRDTTADIMNFEKVLIYTLHFDLEVAHPYSHMIEYVKIFNMDRDKKSKVSTHAWTFINDSYFTNLCLLWEPEVIAISLLNMALKMGFEEGDLTEDNLKYENETPGSNWWDQFVENFSKDNDDYVCHIVLDYYLEASKDENSSKNSNSQSQ